MLVAEGAAWGGALAVVAAVVLLGLTLSILARTPEPRLLPRWAWAVVCVLAFPVGPVAFLVLGQPGRR
ncbi:MAG: PLDc N-terminal domain-containing protein [Thermoleophilia bacterium]